jgi:phage terminase Nu1 subunit (DNA packaging protein)
MKKTTAPERTNLTAVGRAFGVTRTTVRAWRNAGAPIHDAALLGDWLAERQTSLTASESGRDPEMRRLLRERLALQVARLQLDYDAAAGKVHDMATCSASITHAVSELIRVPLEALGGRLAARFPEVPDMRRAVDDEVDAAFAAVRNALGVEVPT